jgi:hypothetical protein
MCLPPLGACHLEGIGRINPTSAGGGRVPGIETWTEADRAAAGACFDRLDARHAQTMAWLEPAAAQPDGAWLRRGTLFHSRLAHLLVQAVRNYVYLCLAVKDAEASQNPAEALRQIQWRR